MEYIVSFISEYASFFETYGNWVLIPLFLIVLVVDYLLSKKNFTRSSIKKIARSSLFVAAIVLGGLIYMINFPLKPMVSSIAKVQRNIGKQVPNFDIVDVRRDSIYNISDFEGGVVLLNFWGTNCKPCIEEFPDLKRIEADYSNQLTVVALSDESVEKIKTFVQKISSPELVGKCSKEQWIDLENFRPLTIVIDKDGIIREYVFGKKDYLGFESLVRKYY